MIARRPVDVSMYILKTDNVRSLTPVKSRYVRRCTHIVYDPTVHERTYVRFLGSFPQGFEQKSYSACGNVENLSYMIFDFWPFCTRMYVPCTMTVRH